MSISRGMDYVMGVCVYEACRLFRDKLVGEDDKQTFDGIVGGSFPVSKAEDKGLSIELHREGTIG